MIWPHSLRLISKLIPFNKQLSYKSLHFVDYYLLKRMMTSSESLEKVEMEVRNLPREETIKLLQYLTPILGWDNHKGQAGRIGIVGGCREYTGAPYYAAISGLRLGCDLSHVFCTSEASPVIKAYSPELIVHPLLDSPNAVAKITSWMSRLHSIIIGPGLGRDKALVDTVLGILLAAMVLDIPIVIDADGIFCITQYPEIIKGNDKVTLTPNAAEFERLYTSLTGKDLVIDDLPSAVFELSNCLKGVNIVCKGKEDIISNGVHVLVCNNEGSPRRCGGQGDLLAGTAGVWQYWANKANSSSNSNTNLKTFGPQLCGAYAACWLTRECNKQAFAKRKRSTLTTDMIEEIGPIVTKYIDICHNE